MELHKDKAVTCVLQGDSSSLSTLLARHPKLATFPIDDEGTSLLHLAPNTSSPSILQLLLSRADRLSVNRRNGDGYTPLHVAALWGKEAAVRLLLKAGADPSIATHEGHLPLDLARSEGHVDCVEALESTDSSPSSSTESYPPDYPPSDSPRTEYESCVETFVSMMADLTVCVSNLSPAPNSPEAAPLDLDDHPVRRTLSFDGCDSDEVRRTSSNGGKSDVDALLEQFAALKASATQTETPLCCPAGTIDLPSCSSGEQHAANSTSHKPSKSCSSSGSSTPEDVSSPPIPIPPELVRLSNDELRAQLLAMGERPGPILPTTRAAYLIYLAKMKAQGKKSVVKQGRLGREYRYELSLVLNGTAPIPDLGKMERLVAAQFRGPCLPRGLNSLTPLKNTKTHFNYLLLDPRSCDRMHGEEVDCLRTFVDAILYVGKGKNSRSLQHLRDARDGMMLPQRNLSSKLRKIREVWSSGRGAMSLHMFHNITAEEAFTREACMIEAIGLHILTNVQRGHVYGDVKSWPVGRRRHFGVYLLVKALRTFLNDPPQEIFPSDI